MSTQNEPEDDTAAVDGTPPTAGPATNRDTDTATGTGTLQLPTSQVPTSPPSVEAADLSGTGGAGRTPDEPSTTPGRASSGPAVRAAEVYPLRVGTVVWGLVLAFLGVGVLAWAGDRSIDVGLAAILLVAGAGVALLVGSLVTGARQRRRAGTTD
jgi:hypothetical protein